MEKVKKHLDYWLSIVQNSSPAYNNLYSEERKFLEKNIPKNAKVLDIGCGDGRSLKTIESITKELTGIDHDKKAVKLAKQNCKINKNAAFLHAEATDLPFSEESFDIILCLGTFTNLGPLKEKALQEMKRVLKKEGIIIVLAYSEKALKERLAMYQKNNILIKKIEGGTVYFDKSIGDNISEQFSKEELQSIFTKQKLKVEEIKETKIAYLCKLRK